MTYSKPVLRGAAIKKIYMPPKYKYLEGEKVLCYHGPLLYEAKVIINRRVMPYSVATNIIMVQLY